MAISQISVPSDKLLPAERYAHLPIAGEIDRLAINYWQKLGLLPSETCSDAEFMRRSSLDAIGALPTIEEARAFAESADPQKREKWIDHLLEQPNWADHWAIRFDDLLRPNPSRVGVKPVLLFDDWLRQSLRQNKHWDALVRELFPPRAPRIHTGRSQCGGTNANLPTWPRLSAKSSSACAWNALNATTTPASGGTSPITINWPLTSRA